jgi:hypothetical protein
VKHAAKQRARGRDRRCLGSDLHLVHGLLAVGTQLLDGDDLAFDDVDREPGTKGDRLPASAPEAAKLAGRDGVEALAARLPTAAAIDHAELIDFRREFPMTGLDQSTTERIGKVRIDRFSKRLVASPATQEVE